MCTVSRAHSMGEDNSSDILIFCHCTPFRINLWFQFMIKHYTSGRPLALDSEQAANVTQSPPGPVSQKAYNPHHGVTNHSHGPICLNLDRQHQQFSRNCLIFYFPGCSCRRQHGSLFPFFFFAFSPINLQLRTATPSLFFFSHSFFSFPSSELPPQTFDSWKEGFSKPPPKQQSTTEADLWLQRRYEIWEIVWRRRRISGDQRGEFATDAGVWCRGTLCPDSYVIKTRCFLMILILLNTLVPKIYLYYETFSLHLLTKH